MLKRLFLAGVAALLCGTSSGCNAICEAHNRDLWRHFCAPCCGETYWHEWFNDPPECCDPCNCCGQFSTCRSHGMRRRCDPYYFKDDCAMSGPVGMSGPTMMEGDAPPPMTGDDPEMIGQRPRKQAMRPQPARPRR